MLDNMAFLWYFNTRRKNAFFRYLKGGLSYGQRLERS